VERLLTVKEAAQYLGLKPQTLYLWVSRRRIVFVKIGRLVRFREKDLEEYVDGQRRAPIT